MQETRGGGGSEVGEPDEPRAAGDWALTRFREHYQTPASGGRKPSEPALSRRQSAHSEGSRASSEGLRPPLAKGERAITKWDIFYYVYGLLHHPGYRTKFADNLKRELPRIPLAPGFWAFADAGRELARLHVDYEKLEAWPLEIVEKGLPSQFSATC